MVVEVGIDCLLKPSPVTVEPCSRVVGVRLGLSLGHRLEELMVLRSLGGGSMGIMWLGQRLSLPGVFDCRNARTTCCASQGTNVSIVGGFVIRLARILEGVRLVW